MKNYGWKEEERESFRETIRNLIDMEDPDIMSRVENGESVEWILSEAENQSILDDIADEVMSMSDEELGIPQFN